MSQMLFLFGPHPKNLLYHPMFWLDGIIQQMVIQAMGELKCRIFGNRNISLNIDNKKNHTLS